MNPVIIIPVFNSANRLAILIDKIRSLYSIPIIIVDDGSEPPVINNFSYSNVEYIVNKENLGKGAALRKGLELAFNKSYTHGITMDSDLQHQPESLELFLSVDDSVSLVYGRRQFNKTMPFPRKVSNFFSSIIISTLSRNKIFDSQCGFRRYRLVDYHNFKYIERGFQFESEVLMKFLRKGLIVKHVKIPTIYDKEDSKINNLIDTIKFIRFVFRFVLCKNKIKR